MLLCLKQPNSIFNIQSPISSIDPCRIMNIFQAAAASFRTLGSKVGMHADARPPLRTLSQG